MNTYYFITPQGKQAGPVPAEQLKSYGVTRKTFVWCEGMKDWTEAENVPELQGIIEQIPPQINTMNVPPQNPLYSGASQNSQFMPEKPDTYLVWAILTTILCCLPFGIVSIVYAAKVDSLYYAERYVEAQDASRKAKNWAIASAATGIAVAIIYAIVLLAAAGSHSRFFY